MKTLDHDQARRVYDRIGRLQDSQAFYEDRAVDLLIREGRFASSLRVFEFGCGTGRVAHRLLTEVLPAEATYLGIDLSPRMIALATERLAPFGARAQVKLSEGAPPTEEPPGGFDRFVSTYVFDLLSEEDIRAVLAAAHRLLEPGGLLCVCGLSSGSDALSRGVAQVWSAVHRVSPSLLGGCRPIELAAFLTADHWNVTHRESVSAFGVPSEVVVAERIAGASSAEGLRTGGIS